MPDPTSIPILIGQLGSEDEDEQRRAVQDLAAIGLPAVPALIHAIRDENPFCEQQSLRACDALEQIGPRSAGEKPGPLVTAVTDSDIAVRRNGAMALGNFGEAGSAPLLAALGDGDSYVRTAISMSLAKLANEGFLVVPALIEALDGTDPIARATAVWAFIYMGAPAGEPAVPALIRALREEDERRRGDVVDALYFVGSAAIPALKEALRSEHWMVRAGASDILGRLVS